MGTSKANLGAVLLFAATLAVLAGCGEGPQGGDTEVTQVDVGDRAVTCVVWDGYNAGGIDCDWANAR